MAAITAQELEMQMPDASKLLSDEPETDSSLHFMQLLLLVTCLEWVWQDRDDFFIGADISIYFSRQQLKKRDFRGPDFFLVKNTTRAHRNSWVVWEEDGRYPDLIEVYQHRLKFAQAELQDLQESQRANQENQRAEQERQRAEQAEATVEKLQDKLRSLGISPE